MYRQSSGSTSRADAVKLLKRKLGEIGRGRVFTPDVERTTLEDLCGMLVNDYRANRRRSVERVGGSLAHLREHLGGMRACDLTTDRVTAYVAARQAAKAANATINRELAALKRMFRLGEISGKVAQRPYIPMLQENNARTGFFEEPEFRGVLGHLPDHLKPVAEVAYVTGWRMRSELLTRQWAHVDFGAGWIRLEPGEAKNREGRMFPLTPTLRVVLERQRAHTRARAHAPRGRRQARGAPAGAAGRDTGGGAAENRQSHGKVSGRRHAARGRQRRGTQRKDCEGNGGLGRD